MEIKEIPREIPINKFENQTQKKMLMNDFTPWCLARHIDKGPSLYYVSKRTGWVGSENCHFC